MGQTDTRAEMLPVAPDLLLRGTWTGPDWQADCTSIRTRAWHRTFASRFRWVREGQPPVARLWLDVSGNGMVRRPPFPPHAPLRHGGIFRDCSSSGRSEISSRH